MTKPTSTEAPGADPAEGDDQRPASFGYAHGRMPLFMKLVWLGFLAFGAWYVARYLLIALGAELTG